MTTTDRQPIEDYAAHRDKLLAHAARMLAEGDRLQASEKLWGAAAHGLKAIAAARGWHYKSHADANVIANHVADLVGNDEVVHLYVSMGYLHENFYEDTMPLDFIEKNLERGRLLVELLRAAGESIPLDAAPPTDRYYVRRAARAAARNASAETGG